MAQSWPVHTYRNSGVQSVGGGLVLGKIRGEERLLFYASVQSGMPFDPHFTAGNSSMGLASLRRDGFTSVEAMMSGSPGSLLTRPLVWDGQLQFLFVNVVIQPGGFLQVAVLDPQTNEPLDGFAPEQSKVGPRPGRNDTSGYVYTDSTVIATSSCRIEQLPAPCTLQQPLVRSPDLATSYMHCQCNWKCLG